MVVQNKHHLHALGSGETQYPQEYSPDLLEAVSNPAPERDYWVRLNCPEFTSLCPVTRQPDFARIEIAYIPDQLLVESKSLKLYLFSYRNQGEFHETCVNQIVADLVKLLAPRYLEAIGYFTPRGGIAIHPYVNCAAEKENWQQFAKERLQQFSLDISHRSCHS